MDIRILLVVASAAVMLLLGLVHLLYTFWGPKLLPRDPGLIHAMKSVAPVLTKETTIWKAWIGFNASHSMAAILFGLVYACLAIAYPAVLFGSLFLRLVGLLMLAGWFALGLAYWFRVPLVGISVSLVCYLAGMLVTTV